MEECVKEERRKGEGGVREDEEEGEKDIFAGGVLYKERVGLLKELHRARPIEKRGGTDQALRQTQ